MSIRFLTIFFSLIFIQLSVCGQQNLSEKSKTPKDSEEKIKQENSVLSPAFKKQSYGIIESNQVKENLDYQKNVSALTLEKSKINDYSAPPNFAINLVSSDVRFRLEENKKSGLPFFEGIQFMLEVDIMDAKLNENELTDRINKSNNIHIPIQVKKIDGSHFAIITDCKTSTAQIKEIFTTAGLTVNFLNKNYILKSNNVQ